MMHPRRPPRGSALGQANCPAGYSKDPCPAGQIGQPHPAAQYSDCHKCIACASGFQAPPSFNKDITCQGAQHIERDANGCQKCTGAAKTCPPGTEDRWNQPNLKCPPRGNPAATEFHQDRDVANGIDCQSCQVKLVPTIATLACPPGGYGPADRLKCGQFQHVVYAPRRGSECARCETIECATGFTRPPAGQDIPCPAPRKLQKDASGCQSCAYDCEPGWTAPPLECGNYNNVITQTSPKGCKFCLTCPDGWYAPFSCPQPYVALRHPDGSGCQRCILGPCPPGYTRDPRECPQGTAPDTDPSGSGCTRCLAVPCPDGYSRIGGCAPGFSMDTDPYSLCSRCTQASSSPSPFPGFPGSSPFPTQFPNYLPPPLPPPPPPVVVLPPPAPQPVQNPPVAPVQAGVLAGSGLAITAAAIIAYFVAKRFSGGTAADEGSK